MQKKFIFTAIFSIVLLGLIAQSASAAYYGYNDYQDTYYEKNTYGYNGRDYVKKEVHQDPWGKTTTYIKTEDYAPRNSYNGYGNAATNYWGYGSNYGGGYLGYGWDDSYRRYVDGSGYHDYYYMPRYYYNGQYYNWHGDNQPRCNNVRYCNW